MSNAHSLRSKWITDNTCISQEIKWRILCIHCEAEYKLNDHKSSTRLDSSTLTKWELTFKKCKRLNVHLYISIMMRV